MKTKNKLFLAMSLASCIFASCVKDYYINDDYTSFPQISAGYYGNGNPDAQGDTITFHSAIITGIVRTEGASPLVECGAYYSTDPYFSVKDTVPTAANQGIYTRRVKCDMENDYDRKTGRFYVHLSELDEITTYYYVTYATNAQGTSFSPTTRPMDSNSQNNAYSYERLVTDTNYRVATIITSDLLEGPDVYNPNPGGNTVVFTGEISHSGWVNCQEWGIRYVPESQLNNESMIKVAKSPEPAPTATSGSNPGSGTFRNLIVSGFEPKTRYCYQTYAINAKGTSYGEWKQFATPGMLACPVFVNVNDHVTDVTLSGCKAEFRLVSIGDEPPMPVTEYGYYLDGVKHIVGNSLAVDETFQVTIGGLRSNAVYKLRPYAINNAAIPESGYPDIEFRTAMLGRRAASNYDGLYTADDNCVYVEMSGIRVNDKVYRFLDRNLGASRPAQNKDDKQAFGWMYQWGRPNDGHQKTDLVNFNYNNSNNFGGPEFEEGRIPKSSLMKIKDNTGKEVNAPFNMRNPVKYEQASNKTLFWSDNQYSFLPWSWWPSSPGDGEFAKGGYNWNAYYGLWSSKEGGGNNNPCPEGYRVPTANEMMAFMENAATAINKRKFVVCNVLRRYNGGIYVGSQNPDTKFTHYWTSDIAVAGAEPTMQKMYPTWIRLYNDLTNLQTSPTATQSIDTSVSPFKVIGPTTVPWNGGHSGQGGFVRCISENVKP